MNPMDRLAKSRGQSLVLMVIGLMAIIIAVALTIDGGNAFAQQRAVQNGTDAAAIAGAVELGNHVSCKTKGCSGPTDAAVKAAIDAAAANNYAEKLPIQVPRAYYTDICGTPLKPNGAPATGVNGSVNLSLAAQVGGGVIPPDIGNSPNCDPKAPASGPTAGVLVFGHVDSPTFIASAVGINTFAIETQATAVSTYGACSATQGCALLPIAFPLFQTTCDGNNDIQFTQPLAPYELNIVYRIPLCKNAPGNIGWLDWTPKAGGVSPIKPSDNSPITFASWQYVAQTGNPNSRTIQTDLRALGGQLSRIVQFDHTCGADQPDSSYPIVNDPAQNFGCPSNFDDGNGSNLWYHLPRMLGMILCDPGIAECNGWEAAYLGDPQGRTVCDTGNGATSCIVGKFVEPDWNGVGASGAPVQLIK